jgi:hypothetical protein
MSLHISALLFHSECIAVPGGPPPPPLVTSAGVCGGEGEGERTPSGSYRSLGYPVVGSWS